VFVVRTLFAAVNACFYSPSIPAPVARLFKRSPACRARPRNAGAKQRGIGTVLRWLTSSALERVVVSVGRVEVQGGTLYAHVQGEELPRKFEDVAGVSACACV
jgi:hypothetical protein